jgi:hypothetical protein
VEDALDQLLAIAVRIGPRRVLDIPKGAGEAALHARSFHARIESIVGGVEWSGAE